MTVLLSIKPEFAWLIFDGTKKFEYRKTIFKRKVEKVVVYASSPISKVIGEFTIEEVLFDDLSELWDKTQHHSGISEQFFYSYFTDKEKGYAIKIRDFTIYEDPQSLHDIYGVHPTQSFVYL